MILNVVGAICPGSLNNGSSICVSLFGVVGDFYTALVQRATPLFHHAAAHSRGPAGVTLPVGVAPRLLCRWASLSTN